MSGAALASARTFRSLRRHHNYRLFFAGQVVSLAGSWMQNVALAWLVIELSGSPLAVGALAFCRFVPFMVLGLVAGVMVDRFDTRRLVIGTQASAMLVSALLAVATLGGFASLPLVYVLAALGGVTLVLDAPGRQTLTFQMVGPRELPNAVALNSGLFNASRVVGPAIAGITIAAVGTGACFAVNALSFLAVLAALLAMREHELVPIAKDADATVAGGIREGLAWVRATPRARIVLVVVTLLSVVGFNFHVLVPLLASDTLHVGPEAFGLLSTAVGIGAVLGSLMAASRREASTRTFTLATAGFGVSLLVLAPVGSYAAVVGVLVALGLCFGLLTTTANALVQLAAPDHLRGRVVSVYLFAFAGLTPVGGLLAGALTELGGTALAFGVAGVVGLGAATWAGARLQPGPVHLGRLSQCGDQAEPDPQPSR